MSIAITARARELPCTFEGTITGVLQARPLVLESSAVRRPSVLLGASRTILAWVSWNQFCTGPYTRIEFLASLIHEGESQPFVLGGVPFVVGRPACPLSLHSAEVPSTVR